MIRPASVVTGAGGFIGYRLANALAAEGHHVVGVDVHFPDPAGPAGPARFVPIVADVRDRDAMRRALTGASVVFHLASAHLRVSLPESEYWDVNVHSLSGLLQLAQEAGVSRFVHTSSVGVYGHTGSTPASESRRPVPQSVYGITKLAGEEAVLAFGNEAGLDVVILRPAWVYGPGCPRTEKLCRALRKRRFVVVGDGRNLRHPIYIDDMVEAFRLAAVTADASGAVFNIAGERAVTTRELLETFCSVFGYAMPGTRIPYRLATGLAAGVESFCRMIDREPPISSRTLEFFTMSNSFDTSRARSILGFVPRHSLERGLTVMRDEMRRMPGTQPCAA